MANCSVVNPKIVPKLLEIISLVLKDERSRSKTFHDAYTFDISTFSKKPQFHGRSVSLVNECLLNHRFEDAAKLLWIMCQDRSCFDLGLYKGIMIVVENLMPSNVNEIVKELSSAFKNLKCSYRLEVQLEYLIYAFKNNIHQQQDSSEFTQLSGTANRKLIPLLQQIYSAYCALLNYEKWVTISQEASCSLNDKNFAISIINSFKALLDQPGTWDIFVLKLIEMLEYYDEFEELERILKKYVACNPEHINAYIYLCVYLHKHKADSEAFIEYAKVLAKLCPSDERVLLLVQAWKELGKKLKKRLKLLFYFLDYPSNGRSILGWKMLSSHLYDVVSRKDSSVVGAIRSLWSSRCHPWNYIHFDSSNINSKDENVKLLLYKVKALTVLEPNHEYIQKAELRFPEISKLKSENNEVTDIKSLYHLER